MTLFTNACDEFNFTIMKNKLVIEPENMWTCDSKHYHIWQSGESPAKGEGQGNHVDSLLIFPYMETHCEGSFTLITAYGM